MIKRAVVVLALLGCVVGVAPAVANAATRLPPLRGHVNSAVLDTFTHQLTVKGWVQDTASPRAKVGATFYVKGRYAGKATANGSYASGHGFTFTVTWTRAVGPVRVYSKGIHVSQGGRFLGTIAVRRYNPPAADRIIDVAKRYVGKARYRDGGNSPAGFDCSGYTQYAYRIAKVRTLPHNAEAQRRAMKHVAASAARPGDLVFYLSGGRAYHVAIYAGNHKQYAAATPRAGIRYQAVWSSNVVYGTILH